MRLILYSKPGCHLCEGLQEKLEQIQSISIDLDIRDISTREDWLKQYQYEIPVLILDRSQESSLSSSSSPSAPFIRLPRLSPRAPVSQLEQMLQKYETDPAQ